VRRPFNSDELETVAKAIGEGVEVVGVVQIELRQITGRPWPTRSTASRTPSMSRCWTVI
jgi:hypothetical protein